MCTLLGHNPFHYCVIQLQSFFPYICKETKNSLPGVPFRCSCSKCTSTATALLSLERLLVTIAAEAATSHDLTARVPCPMLARPALPQAGSPKMARRAPQSTSASSQVCGTAERITTCGVDVLISTELRRSCAAEHLVHTGRSSCEC